MRTTFVWTMAFFVISVPAFSQDQQWSFEKLASVSGVFNENSEDDAFITSVVAFGETVYACNGDQVARLDISDLSDITVDVIDEETNAVSKAGPFLRFHHSSVSDPFDLYPVNEDGSLGETVELPEPPSPLDRRDRKYRFANDFYIVIDLDVDPEVTNSNYRNKIPVIYMYPIENNAIAAKFISEHRLPTGDWRFAVADDDFIAISNEVVIINRNLHIDYRLFTLFHYTIDDMGQLQLESENPFKFYLRDRSYIDEIEILNNKVLVSDDFRGEYRVFELRENRGPLSYLMPFNDQFNYTLVDEYIVSWGSKANLVFYGSGDPDVYVPYGELVDPEKVVIGLTNHV